jgi:uncharacterized protein YeaO (DUF488 family)
VVVDYHALLHPTGGQTTRINKRVGWHTFRRTYTTLLHANGEDVKAVQELLRHSSSRITMDVYAQAQTPAKRAAQQKTVEMVRVGTASAGRKDGLSVPQKVPRRKQGFPLSA